MVNDGEIPYEKFGDILTEVHWVMAITESFEKTNEQSLYETLQMILDHTFGKEAHAEAEFFREFEYGLDGHDAWINAFGKGSADPLCNAYNSEVVSCARNHAVQFFDKLIQQWNGQTNLEKDVSSLLEEAKSSYTKVAEQMKPMPEMFIFPDGGTPNEPEYKERALECLKHAKRYETEGANILRKVYERLNQELEGKSS